VAAITDAGLVPGFARERTTISLNATVDCRAISPMSAWPTGVAITAWPSCTA
jgi:hypothetical protein